MSSFYNVIFTSTVNLFIYDVHIGVALSASLYVNDKINRGDLIMRLFANNMSNLIIAKKLVNESYIIK